ELRSLAASRGLKLGGRRLSQSFERRLRALAIDPFNEGPKQALRELDDEWGRGGDRRQILDLGATAATTLLLETNDALEIGDRLGGKALGVLALLEWATTERRPELEAIVAAELGYANEARAIGLRLPQVHPVRLFLSEDDEALGRAARVPSASAFTRYLFALRLARKQPIELDSWIEPEMNLGNPRPPTLKVLLQRSRMALGGQVDPSIRLIRTALHEIGAPKPELGRDVLRTFERGIRALPVLRGPFFDAALDENSRRAEFYSGLCLLGCFYLDSLGSPVAARKFFAENLAEADPGPGLEFRDWFDHVTAVSEGKQGATVLVNDLGHISLGQAIARRTGSQLTGVLYATDPQLVRTAAALAQALDSRLANANLFAHICRGALHHPIAGDAYYDAYALGAARGQELAPWLANIRGDSKSLFALANDRHASGETRLQAITHLREARLLSKSDVRSRLLDVLAAPTTEADTFMGAIRLLWEDGWFEDAERVLRKWLLTHRQETALRRTLYASRLAHVLFLERRFADAFAAIEPWIPTGKADAFWAGAEALEGLGRHQDALTMARSHVERYPGTWSSADLAQILWRQREYSAAPERLVDSRYPVGPNEWRDPVAKRFFEVFEREPVIEVVKAFRPLIGAGVNPWFLFDFAEPFANTGHYDTAIALIDEVCKSKNETMDGYLRAYKYRRGALGLEGANRWLRETVLPSKSASWIAEAAFTEREFEILWLLPDSDSNWLYRAEAAALSNDTHASRRAELLANFRLAKTKPENSLYGLYLLGAEPRERLFDLAGDLPHRCDAACLIGMKSIGDGDLAEGADWLRVAVKTGQSRAWTYERALSLLDGWDGIARARVQE
ncbi:MAG TPA: hypothetical protein VKF32_03425, partial [Thermoanaerobaculia bacterium]|nr:hypothetical protein [Thermoanaerobaculia bacterium]